MNVNVSDELASDIRVTVVIPCYNAEKTLSDTLDAIVTQAWDKRWDILVSDNKSTDGSREIVKQFQRRYPLISLVDAFANQGTSCAVNTGVKAARGRSVVICDSDDIPTPGWLAAMGEALETHEFVACRMDVESLNSGAGALSRRNAQTEQLGKIGYPPYLPHAGGGTLGFRREIFLRVEGYDEKLNYLHDTDFCFKVQLAGSPLIFVGDAVIKIRFRTNFRKTYLQARNWAEYNILLAKRYRHHGLPPAHRWRRLYNDGKTILQKLSHWPRLTEKERYRTMWLLGWELGKIKGMVKYFAPPF